MADDAVRPAGDQFVIFVQPGVDAELAAEMAYGGPRQDDGGECAKGGAGDAPPLGRGIGGQAAEEGNKDCQALQEQAGGGGREGLMAGRLWLWGARKMNGYHQTAQNTALMIQRRDSISHLRD